MKKHTTNRLTLFRECGTCGGKFTTSADSPWMRSIHKSDENGKKQVTTYYCSTTCFQKSYIHKGWYDGKTWERKQEREKTRIRVYTPEQLEKKRATNREYMRRLREADPDMTKRDNEFYRKKRKLKLQESRKID